MVNDTRLHENFRARVVRFLVAATEISSSAAPIDARCVPSATPRPWTTTVSLLADGSIRRCHAIAVATPSQQKPIERSALSFPEPRLVLSLPAASVSCSEMFFP